MKKKNPVLMVLLAATVLGAVFFGILMFSAALSGKRATASLPVVGANRLALVKIEGLLLGSEQVVEELRNYTEDSSIKAIVIRIDSPGGGVVPSQEIYNAVKNARREGKKVVVSMGSVAASGGYYIAAAADKIVANPGTLTGSIGVKMEFPNFEKLLEKIGVKGMVVKAGEFKDVGSPYRDMTPQEQKLLQNVIDDVHDQFIKAVAEGRGLPEADVRTIADGRIFTGQQALALRLVDQLGDLAESIQTAGGMVGFKGKPTVVEKRKKIPFFEYLKEESAAWIAGVVNRAFSDGSSVKLQYIYH
jgi:protease IV